MSATEVSGTYELVNQLGLHARAAAQLVKTANRHKCDVTVECDGQSVNAKSIMGLLSLAAGVGMQIKVTCKGEGADVCLAEMAALVAGRFGEGR